MYYNYKLNLNVGRVEQLFYTGDKFSKQLTWVIRGAANTNERAGTCQIAEYPTN